MNSWNDSVREADFLGKNSWPIRDVRLHESLLARLRPDPYPHRWMDDDGVFRGGTGRTPTSVD